MYHLNMALNDIENCDTSELQWLYNRLVKEKKDEQDEIEKSYKR